VTMERLTELEPVFVKEIPKDKEHGKLYVSEYYGTAIHLCCCGCGALTVTPIAQDGIYCWTYARSGDNVTLSPSVYNSHEPCKSHYFIRDNKVVWC